MFDRRFVSNLGIHVYGFAAIALGVIGLVWGDFTTVWQPVPPGIAYHVVLAYAAAVCFLLAGAAVQWRRTARAGLVVLALLYCIFAALWLQRVIGFPQMIGTWLGFAEEFALVVAAVVACFAGLSGDSRGAAITVRISYIVFGLCAIVFGLAHFIALQGTTAFVPKWIPPGQQFWAIFTGVAHSLAGIAILTGVLSVPASRLFTLMLLGFGALVWIPMLMSNPHEHTMWAGNAINLALAGAAWIVADSIANRRKPA
jgi:uncharacterized membrane protein YphA (DoxX/SURF4 family)